MTSYLGTASSPSTMTTLKGRPGDYCLRTDQRGLYTLIAADSTSTSNWMPDLAPVRTTTVTTSATPTPDAAADDVYAITALDTNAVVGAPTGAVANGQILTVRIKDNGTARTLSWNAVWRPVGVALPTTTVAGKTLYVRAVWNSADSKWDVVHTGTQAMVINVKDFGADGGGIVEDAPAVQAAFNSLPIASGNEIGGGLVFFPKGVYLCNTVTSGAILKLTNKPNVTVIGAGDGTRIRVSTATADDLMRVETCNAFHIENILFQFIGSAQVGNALNITTENPVGSVHSTRIVNVKVSSNGAFKTAMDVMTVSGSNVVWSAQAAFAAGDVGGRMMVDLNNGPWLSSITEVATVTATLAADITTTTAASITLTAPLSGAPASGFTIVIGTERMYVTGGGNTTTLSVNRGRGNDGIRSTHTSGATVTTYKATLDSNAPSSTSTAVGMARIQGAGTAMVDVGLALATDHAGSPDLDVAGTKVDNYVASRCMVAGIQVGNGTTGDVLCQWGESLDISECGYGVFLHAGSLTGKSGGSTGNLVDFRRFQPVSQAFYVEDWRTESCGMFYKMTGAATGGPLVTCIGIQVQQFRSEDGIVFQHLNSAPVTLIANSWSSSAVFAGSVYVACQGTSASPCHLTVINCVTSGGNLDPFTASPTPGTITNVIGMSRVSTIGVVSTNSVVGVSFGSRVRVGGGFVRARTAVADANYTITNSDTFLALTSITAPRVWTPPAQGASLLVAQEFPIMDESGSLSETITLTITPAAGTINGAASLVLDTPYASGVLYTNGTNWFWRKG